MEILTVLTASPRVHPVCDSVNMARAQLLPSPCIPCAFRVQIGSKTGLFSYN